MNFFDNAFSEDLGDVLFYNEKNSYKIDFTSLFDNGSSLYFNEFCQNAHLGYIRSATFDDSQNMQISLVTDFDWYDSSKLDGIGEECREILSRSKFLDKERIDFLVKAIELQARFQSFNYIKKS